MEIGRPAHFAEQYHKLLSTLLSREPETNARTGHRIKAEFGGVTMRINLRDGTVPVCGHRKQFPHQSAAELAWFLMGTRSIKPLRDLGCGFWDKFVDELPDGILSVPGSEQVRNAYGYRWRQHFHRDQIAESVASLCEDPSSRQVLVSAWDPSLDGLANKGAKNIPCPASFTFSIVGGCLHSTLLIRSSDVFVGLPYDVMGHAMLMDVIASSVKYPSFPGSRDVKRPRLGVMQVTLAHPHLYDSHWEQAQECVDGYRGPITGPEMAGWELGRVEGSPSGFVDLYRERSKRVYWPAIMKRPEVIS